jgi:anti-sigma factor RsiW
VSAQGRDVQAANARLPERRRMVLALRELEDMSDEDTGRVEIGALIDGELDPDRAQVLTAHLASCDACRAARASFEDARVTYRAWLPLPVLGLGDATARAAAARSGALLGRPTAAPGLAGRGARRHDRTGRAGARARDDDRRRDDGRGLHAGAPPPPAPPPPVIE